MAQGLAHVVGPTGLEVTVEQGERRTRHRRGRGETSVGPAVPRQCREQHAVIARDVGQPLDPVSPVIEPAQATQDDDARPSDDIVDVEVDRQGMPQPFQAGETKVWQQVGIERPGRRQRRQVAVREGEHHDLGR